MIRRTRRLLVLLLVPPSCIPSSNASRGSDGGDAGTQETELDASGIDRASVDGEAVSCDPRWPALDPTRACTYGFDVALGVCVSTTTHTKGIYELCAVRPDGVWFYLSVPTDVQITFSGGWSFGPVWLANLLKLSALTSAQDALCEGIVEGPSGLKVPECGDSGNDDAETPDGFSEQ